MHFSYSSFANQYYFHSNHITSSFYDSSLETFWISKPERKIKLRKNFYLTFYLWHKFFHLLQFELKNFLLLQKGHCLKRIYKNPVFSRENSGFHRKAELKKLDNWIFPLLLIFPNNFPYEINLFFTRWHDNFIPG